MTLTRCLSSPSTSSIMVMLSCPQGRLIGCLLVTHLSVKAELQRRPGLSGQPFIVAGGGSGNQVVFDAVPEVAGVVAGQSVSEALSRCAAAVIVPADDQYLAEVNDGLLAALHDTAPQVEIAGLGLFYLDLTGLPDAYGGFELMAGAILSAVSGWMRPRLGVARGKFPAYCAAARAGAGDWLLTPDNTPAWLAPLSTSWLPLERSTAARLEGLGIRTLGDVAALSPSALVDFLGPSGARVWELANGVDRAPVIPALRPEMISECLEFPHPLDTRTGLEAGVVALAERVWRGPGLRGRVVGHAALEGQTESGQSWSYKRALIRPAGSPQSLSRALLAGLDAQDTRGGGRWPREALLELALTVSELSTESGSQRTFQLWPQHSRPELPEVPGVDRLVNLTPLSSLPERRWALRSSLAPLAAPSPVEVQCDGATPQRVEARGVIQALDLWEVDTEWWMPEPVRRCYWRLALADGGLVTVYRDLLTGRWFRQ